MLNFCTWKERKIQVLKNVINVTWTSAEELDSYQFALNVRTYIEEGFEYLNK